MLRGDLASGQFTGFFKMGITEMICMTVIEEISCKIKSYLAFLNITQLKRPSADIQSKAEILNDLN